MPTKPDGPDRDAGVEPARPEPAPAAATETLLLPTPVQVPRPALPGWLLILPALTLVVGRGSFRNVTVPTLGTMAMLMAVLFWW